METIATPRSGERWLSCPPFLMIAHVKRVERVGAKAVVSYELQDEDGALLQSVEHALLDDGWYRAFQPMRERWG